MDNLKNEIISNKKILKKEDFRSLELKILKFSIQKIFFIIEIPFTWPLKIFNRKNIKKE